MASALRAAVLGHVRVPVFTPLGIHRSTFIRSMSSHDDHLEKSQVVDRIIDIVKSFPKVDPSKVSKISQVSVCSMALPCSKRLLRLVGSNYKVRCCKHPDAVRRSFHILSTASYDHDIGCKSSLMENSIFKKVRVSLMGSRGLCTSTLSSESSEGSFPSDLLTRKQVITPERVIGQLQDLVIPVTNFHNEDKGLMVLAGDVFDLPIRKDIIHRVVRWQLAKRQQGTHSTKTISEVSGTGRKPWRQKGTGRARHGSLHGPQFRHGAVMHGPKPRSHAHKLNKQVRRLGLKIALSARAAEGKLLVFDDLEVPTHKTKNIVSYVNQMEETKKVLLVDGGPIDEKLKLATQNLHYVNVLPSIGLNVYSILLHDTLVMSRDAVNKIVERMHTPINR